MALMQDKHSAQGVSQVGNPSQKFVRARSSLLNQIVQASLATERVIPAHVRYIYVFLKLL